MADHLEPKVQWSLTDEGMGVLERAGLAGLYLSLTAAEEWAAQGDPQALELRDTLAWELSDLSIELSWPDKDAPPLRSLVDWAWQVKEGVFYLPGVHLTQDTREHRWLRLDTHKGLLQTFFQHNKVWPRDQGNKEVIQLDEGRFFQENYQKLKLEKEKLSQISLFDKIIKQGVGEGVHELLASWIYPGAAKRFGKGDKEEEHWSGPAKICFLLLFAPIACVFFELPRTKGKPRGGNKASKIKPKGGKNESKSKLKPNWAFLIPEIVNLESLSQRFPSVRQQAPADFLRVQVQGLGDAALRFASAYAGRVIARKLKSQKIYLAAMGQVSHYQNQRVRKRLMELAPSEVSILRYSRLMNCLDNKFALPPKSEKVTDPTGDESAQEQMAMRVRQSKARGRIADNLVSGRPWYRDLLWPTDWQLDELEEQRQWRKKSNEEHISLEMLWFENLVMERSSLIELTEEEAMWDSPEEQALEAIFRSTLRNLLNKEEEALKRGGSRRLRERWEDRRDDILRALKRAKTRELNRKFLMEFLAEGGGSKDLTENKEAVWRFLNHPYEWQKARDLALLALVTFTDGRLGKEADKPAKGEVTGNE